RVVEVLFGGVAVAEGRGDAALRPPGGAVVEPGLGDDDRGEAGRFAAQGGGETGDAGADDHHVRLDGPPGLGRVQAGPGARLRVVGDGRRGAGAKRTRLRVVVGDGRRGAGAWRTGRSVGVGARRRVAGTGLAASTAAAGGRRSPAITCQRSVGEGPTAMGVVWMGRCG